MITSKPSLRSGFDCTIHPRVLDEQRPRSPVIIPLSYNV